MVTNFRYKASARVAVPSRAQRITKAVTAISPPDRHRCNREAKACSKKRMPRACAFEQAPARGIKTKNELLRGRSFVLLAAAALALHWIATILALSILANLALVRA